ncbi:MAG: hypothetical protein ACK559_24990, partial [bacterium]
LLALGGAGQRVEGLQLHAGAQAGLGARHEQLAVAVGEAAAQGRGVRGEGAVGRGHALGGFGEAERRLVILAAQLELGGQQPHRGIGPAVGGGAGHLELGRGVGHP